VGASAGGEATMGEITNVMDRGGARMTIFSLLGGANHTNLYKNLIKI